MIGRTVGIAINLVIFIFSLVGTFALVKKLKFEDNNSRIIFLLYIIYWISPLLCRDYASMVHVHLDIGDSGKLMWIPVITFGLVGVLWRPLNDVLTYKFKSRKLIIYLSILIQFLTLLTFLLYPCFATNIVQSVGCGVGASGIGLFTLMFNENQKSYKKILTISLFSLPPIIAGFIVSALESFVAAFIPSEHTTTEYLNIIWFVYLIALVFIITSFILAFFIKEKRATLYQDNTRKEPIQSQSGHWKMVLLCLCAVCLTFIRWATAGPFAGMQLTYIASEKAVDTSLWEGYLGVVYSFGCLLGSIISAICIVKSNSKVYQPIVVGVGIFSIIIYLIITSCFVNVPVYFWMHMVNGISFGLMWNIFMEIVLNKFYKKQNVVTPIGVFNMSLSVGISLGSMFIGMIRYVFFNFHYEELITWNDFLKSNYISSFVLITVALLLGGLFAGYFVLSQICKDKKVLVDKKQIAMIGETEL